MLRKPNLVSLLDQITQILEMKSKIKDKLVAELPPDIEQEVAEMEKFVNEFAAVSEQLFKSLGYKPGELEALLQDPSRLEARDQAVIQRAGKLKTEASATETLLGTALEAAKKIGNLRSDDPSKRAQERKKRLGRIGGRKGWTPM